MQLVKTRPVAINYFIIDGSLIIKYYLGTVANVINSVAQATDLTSLASLLTKSLTSITDASLLRQILTSGIGVDLLNNLRFPILTDGLLKLIGSMLGGLVDLRGLTNFVARPSAREIFSCPANGSYLLNIYPFAGTINFFFFRLIKINLRFKFVRLHC